jgi:hypothetical protein
MTEENPHALSPSEHQQMREESEAILAFLRSQFDALTPERRQALYNEASHTISGALKEVAKKVPRIPGLKLKNPDEPICIISDYRSPKNVFATYDGPHIEWGVASSETKTIRLLHWLIFAPKEVCRAVATHEAFHIVFAALDPDCLPNIPEDETLADYPKHQRKEERWVRDMTKKMGYDEHLTTVWEQALLMGGANWRPSYIKLKKDFRAILARD